MPWPMTGLCRLLNYDIFLNEIPTYFGKCHKLSYDISQNVLEIHSKICCNLKVNIWLELDLNLAVLCFDILPPQFKKDWAYNIKQFI